MEVKNKEKKQKNKKRKKRKKQEVTLLSKQYPLCEGV
jgi:hypothetical protein